MLKFNDEKMVLEIRDSENNIIESIDISSIEDNRLIVFVPENLGRDIIDSITEDLIESNVELSSNKFKLTSCCVNFNSNFFNSVELPQNALECIENLEKATLALIEFLDNTELTKFQQDKIFSLISNFCIE